MIFVVKSPFFSKNWLFCKDFSKLLHFEFCKITTFESFSLLSYDWRVTDGSIKGGGPSWFGSWFGSSPPPVSVKVSLVMSCPVCRPSGAYVPEGLLTSCTWDYMTFTPSVRAYTMLLFIFVFFLPLFIIIYCYIFIFRAIRSTNQSVPLLFL